MRRRRGQEKRATPCHDAACASAIGFPLPTSISYICVLYVSLIIIITPRVSRLLRPHLSGPGMACICDVLCVCTGPAERCNGEGEMS
jgi:hypothetical protein